MLNSGFYGEPPVFPASGILPESLRLPMPCERFPGGGPHIKFGRLVEDAGVLEVLKRTLEAGRGYLAEPGNGSGNYLTCFLDAVRRHYALGRWLIQSPRCERQGPLLRREVVQRLSFDFDYCFRETILIEEFRTATGLEQPTRYGKDGIPAFALTEALVKGDRTPGPSPTASPPHTQTPVPPDIEFLRRRYPPPRDPGAITRGQFPSSISISRLGE